MVEGVELADVNHVEVGAQVTADVNLVADGEIEVDDGELALPLVEVGTEKGRVDYLNARKGVMEDPS